MVSANEPLTGDVVFIEKRELQLQSSLFSIYHLCLKEQVPGGQSHPARPQFNQYDFCLEITI